MGFSSMGDAAVLKELGKRIRQQRLNLNVSQEDLAKKAGVARSVVQKIEQGEACMIDGWLRVLRSLGVLDQLNAFLPDPGVSPLQLARLQNRERQRASRKHSGVDYSRDEKDI